MILLHREVLKVPLVIIPWNLWISSDCDDLVLWELSFLRICGYNAYWILLQSLCFKRNEIFAIWIELNGVFIFKVVNYVQKSTFSLYTPTSKACRAFERAFNDASSTVLIPLRRTGFTLLNLILQLEESKHRDQTTEIVYSQWLCCSALHCVLVFQNTFRILDPQRWRAEVAWSCCGGPKEDEPKVSLYSSRYKAEEAKKCSENKKLWAEHLLWSWEGTAETNLCLHLKRKGARYDSTKKPPQLQNLFGSELNHCSPDFSITSKHKSPGFSTQHCQMCKFRLSFPQPFWSTRKTDIRSFQKVHLATGQSCRNCPLEFCFKHLLLKENKEGGGEPQTDVLSFCLLHSRTSEKLRAFAFSHTLLT